MPFGFGYGSALYHYDGFACREDGTFATIRADIYDVPEGSWRVTETRYKWSDGAVVNQSTAAETVEADPGGSLPDHLTEPGSARCGNFDNPAVTSES